MPRTSRNLIAGTTIVFLILTLVLGLSYLAWDPAAATTGQWKKALDLVTGFWLGAAMLCGLWLGLKNKTVERFVGGPAVRFRLHKATGWLCAALLAIHWWLPLAAVRTANWLAGAAPAARPMQENAFSLTGWLGHEAAWSGYPMAVLIVLSLAGAWMTRKYWLRTHRLWTVIALIGALHGLLAFPGQFAGSFGQYLAGLMLVATVIFAGLHVRRIAAPRQASRRRARTGVLEQPQASESGL